MKVKSESEVAQSYTTLCDPVDCSLQAPLSLGFSRQEYWSRLPLPSPKMGIEYSLWTKEPGGRQSIGLQTVGHDLETTHNIILLGDRKNSSKQKRKSWPTQGQFCTNKVLVLTWYYRPRWGEGKQVHTHTLGMTQWLSINWLWGRILFAVLKCFYQLDMILVYTLQYWMHGTGYLPKPSLSITYFPFG